MGKTPFFDHFRTFRSFSVGNPLRVYGKISFSATLEIGPIQAPESQEYDDIPSDLWLQIPWSALADPLLAEQESAG